MGNTEVLGQLHIQVCLPPILSSTLVLSRAVVSRPHQPVFLSNFQQTTQPFYPFATRSSGAVLSVPVFRKCGYEPGRPVHPCPLLLRPTEWKNSYLRGTGTLSTGEEKPQNELVTPMS